MAKKNGHHGGAWKIAYADFMTAMMAFFLLLWLLSLSEEEDKLKGIANYFQPSEVTLTNVGGEGVMSGSSPAEDDLLGESVPAAESEPDTSNDLSPEGKDSPNREESENASAAAGSAAAGAANPWSQFVTEQASATADGAVANLASDIRERLNPFAESVRVHEEDGNVLIDILDLGQTPMFESGSDAVTDANIEIVREIVEILVNVGGRIVITGHTDTIPYSSDDGYSNWELSADRANAIRRTMIGMGVGQDRITRVSGVADTDPMEGTAPEAPENRRISIEITTGM